MKNLPAGTDRRSHLAFAPALVLLIVSAIGILAAALSPSGDRGLYAVVGPPWYDVAQTVNLIVTAGGNIVDFGGLANVAIVHSEDPRFTRALYRAGAWVVIDPGGLLGCLGSRRGASSLSRAT